MSSNFKPKTSGINLCLLFYLFYYNFQCHICEINNLLTARWKVQLLELVSVAADDKVYPSNFNFIYSFIPSSLLLKTNQWQSVCSNVMWRENAVLHYKCFTSLSCKNNPPLHHVSTLLLNVCNKLIIIIIILFIKGNRYYLLICVVIFVFLSEWEKTFLICF